MEPFALQGLFFSSVDLFLDAGLLTGEVAEVEDTCATHFTVLVHLDAVNERGREREDSFDSDTAGNLADGERLRERIHALHLDDDSSELLEALLVSFLDPVGHGDGVTCLELREFGGLATGKSLLCYFDQIHNFNAPNLMRNFADQLLRQEVACSGLQM